MLQKQWKSLESEDPKLLVETRYEKFRNIGAFEDIAVSEMMEKIVTKAERKHREKKVSSSK